MSRGAWRTGVVILLVIPFIAWYGNWPLTLVPIVLAAAIAWRWAERFVR